MIKKVLRKVRWSLNRKLEGPAQYFASFTTEPLSNRFGFDRGTPTDRYYIEKFVMSCKDLIKGDCLEVQAPLYLNKLDNSNITSKTILDIVASNKDATLIGDMRNLTNVMDNSYDTLIVTQTFHLIDDLNSALKECHRILRQGGVLIATFPALSRIDPDSGAANDNWRLTPAGCKNMFGQHFGKANVDITPFGNALAGWAFWVGLAQEELPTLALLDTYDPMFPVSTGIKAFKR
jgi:SAM-dependent methyltransferase